MQRMLFDKKYTALFDQRDALNSHGEYFVATPPIRKAFDIRMVNS